MRALILISAVLLAIIIGGCEDQPTGYIFEPPQREQVLVTRTAADFMRVLFDHADQAAKFLDDAAQTDDFSTVLPAGWLPYQDPLGEADDTVYIRNYLDQRFSLLRFDRNPNIDAIRTPSNITFDYLEIGSFLNGITNTYYGDTSLSLNLDVEYSNNRQDPNHIEGWFQVFKYVEFEQELAISGTGVSTGTTVKIPYYLPVVWLFNLKNFSVSSSDHTAHISITGAFPMLDEENDIQQPQFAAEIELDKNGQGIGELWLYGERVSRIHFTGRGFGFNGYFTLYKEDHSTRYNLKN